MKTFKEFMEAQDLNTLAADISATAKRDRPVPNKPNYNTSQSEPIAPQNAAPAILSAANQATKGHAGAIVNGIKNLALKSSSQLIRGTLGANKP